MHQFDRHLRDGIGWRHSPQNLYLQPEVGNRPERVFLPRIVDRPTRLRELVSRR